MDKLHRRFWKLR